MRLFTTRSRRPDRAPEVRPLDLVTMAESHGRIPARGRMSDGVAVGRELGAICGLRVQPATGLTRSPDERGSVAADVTHASRTVSVRFGSSTRRAWLGIVLCHPAGTVEDHELPAEPTPLERAVLERTLVAPVARVVLGLDAHRDLSIVWSFETGASGVGRMGDGCAVPMDLGLVAGTVSGPAFLRLLVSIPAVPGEAHLALDRSLRSAVLPVTVRLDPALAGLSIRAGDLSRLEPGDVLVTDLPAEACEALPIEAVGASGGSPGSPHFSLRGRAGLAGGRRGVRFEPVEPIGDARHPDR